MYITFNNKSITEQEIDINYYNKMPTKKIKLVCIEICDDCNIKHSVKIEAQCKNYKNNFNSVISQLLQKIPKDKHRKVCKGCHDIGHNMNSAICKLNIEKNNLLKKKIKKYMLSQDCLSGKTNDDHFIELSNMYEISVNMCKTLYEEIQPIELCNRSCDITLYFQQFNQMIRLNCHQCNKVIYNIHANTNRIWKGKNICDSCWSEHQEERDFLWNKVSEYKTIQCYICSKRKIKDGERFHYDHLNMFDKGNSICSMVNEGNIIDDIYIELDKCQILCLSCHHIVTDIENNLVFTRIKQNLTRKLNNFEITEEEYNQKKIEIGLIYVNKMYEIYNQLKLCINLV